MKIVHKIWPMLLSLILGLILPWMPEAQAEAKPRLAILPFIIEKEAVCPLCKRVFQRGEILPGSQNTLTRLFYQKMEATGTFHILPLEKVEETLSHQLPPIQAGKELQTDFLFVGYLFRFEERIGSSLGAEKPASVGFDFHLLRVKDGVEVWRGKMDETQRPLSENLFKIGSFFRRKASWLTAEELAGVGMSELLRRLPGARELEEKQ